MIPLYLKPSDLALIRLALANIKDNQFWASKLDIEQVEHVINKINNTLNKYKENANG